MLCFIKTNEVSIKMLSTYRIVYLGVLFIATRLYDLLISPAPTENDASSSSVDCPEIKTRRKRNILSL